MSVNQVYIFGSLQEDPQERAKGTAFFRLETSHSVPKGDQTIEVPDWHNIVCFGKTAELCLKYLKKGSYALVEGKLSTKKYTDKKGVVQYSTSIVASRLTFLDQKKEQQIAPPQQLSSSFNINTFVPTETTYGEVPF